jgi:RNA polymerase sigma-70 factor (ECF subfamily)
MVQEAMLRLWDQADRWQRGKQGVGAWLKRVVTNMAIDRLRRTRRIAGDAIPEQADGSPLADSAMIADEAAQQARAIIAALPDKQRAAIVLTYYEGLSNADAADAMDMHIKAFESLLYRARAAIKASFAALPSATEAKGARV